MLFCCMFIVVSCQEKSNKREQSKQLPLSNATQPTNKIEQSEKSIPIITASFLLQSLGEMNDGSTPFKVHLTVGNKRYLIDTIYACAQIETVDFKQFDIPLNALAACGGWWAGQGNYLYCIAAKNSIEIYNGWQDEQQEIAGFHWKKVKSIPVN